MVRYLQHVYPELFSFYKDPFASVQKVKSAVLPITFFHLPLYTEAYEQFQQLDIMIQSIHLQQAPDQWTYL
jgi:hypothetical protein